MIFARHDGDALCGVSAVAADDGKAVLQILPRRFGLVFQQDAAVVHAVGAQPDGHGLGLGDALVVALTAGDDRGRVGVGVHVIERRVQAVFHREGGRHAVHLCAEHDEEVCLGVCVRVRGAEDRDLQDREPDCRDEHERADDPLSRARQTRQKIHQQTEACHAHADVFGRGRDEHGPAAEHEHERDHKGDRMLHSASSSHCS